MGKYWEKGMDSIEKFVSFPAMNCERTLVVLFQILPLILRVILCGRRKRIYI